MKFGIFCNNYTEQNIEAVAFIIDCLLELKLAYCLNKDLSKHLDLSNQQTYVNNNELKELADVLITVGGDGTILNAVHFVYGSSIPVLGVNTGRLGYLTSLTPETFRSSLKDIKDNKFHTEERSLIEIETTEEIDSSSTLALNEISVLKKDSSSMITIHAYLDGEFLNTYWADGLIISTATGSTAYSLSCGGPIMAPGSGNFIITPIAPHNLNVRPLVIPDESQIELRFESRSSELLMALDSSTRTMSDQVHIKIRKAPKKIGLLRSEQYSYLETLRSKLNWGLDKRN